MRVWHGSSKLFTEFSLDHVGSGEGGDGMGYGLYFAEHRAGGEYFAKYMCFRTGEGYLYEVDIDVLADEVVDADRTRNNEVLARTGMTFSRLCEVHRGSSIIGLLQRSGIHLLSRYEETKPSHGLSYLCVSPSRAKVLRKFKHSPQPYGWIEVA